ncbi:MAG: hypothetical protein JWM99_3681, partial [Verrucomicrobiales bacterium]|nr:hypothetical protein [Verrucomicrobiales bacterium]
MQAGQAALSVERAGGSFAREQPSTSKETESGGFHLRPPVHPR